MKRAPTHLRLIVVETPKERMRRKARDAYLAARRPLARARAWVVKTGERATWRLKTWARRLWRTLKRWARRLWRKVKALLAKVVRRD